MGVWHSPWLPPPIAVLLADACPAATVALTGQVRRRGDRPF